MKILLIFRYYLLFALKYVILIIVKIADITVQITQDGKIDIDIKYLGYKNNRDDQYPGYFYALNIVLPSFIVSNILIFLISILLTFKGFLSNITKSASLPSLILPFISSSKY